MPNKGQDSHIKRMADLLSQGATLTDLACPSCGSPLFRLKDGSLWCEKDEKKVIIVREGEEVPKSSRMQSPSTLNTLENTLMMKIEDIQRRIERTEDVHELQTLTSALSDLLDNLEKVRKIEKS